MTAPAEQTTTITSAATETTATPAESTTTTQAAGGEQAAAAQQQAADTSTPGAAQKVDELPDWAQKVIRDARAEAAKYRTEAKTAADDLTQQIGKALGLIKDNETVDPAQLQQTLAQTQDQLYGLKVEQAVNRAAARAGADADLVTAKLAYEGKLDDLDPASQDFATQIDSLVTAAVTENPRLRAAQAAAVGGAQIVGSGSAPARTYTREQLRDPAFYAANRDDILAAQREGRIRE